MRALAPIGVLLVLVLAGCADVRQSQADEPQASPSSPAESPSAAAPAPPEVGSCHDLTLQQATATAVEDTEVPCREPHTSVTVALRPPERFTEGPGYAAACPQRLARWAGGDETSRRLSRLQVVWFAPTADQAEAGADQVRCDLVAVGSQDRLLRLPARSRGMLDRSPEVAERYATCGTAAPDAPRFARVSCGQPHRWRAVGTHDFPEGTRHLGRAATDGLDAACEEVAADRSDDALELTWASEWPTRAQWDDGQRWGWCWVPDRA